MAEFRKTRAALRLTIALAVSGCAGVSTPARVNSPLVGQWRQTTLGSDSESKPCPTQILLSDGTTVNCGQHDTVEFKADGSFVANFSGGGIQASGTWRVQDSTLLVTFTAPQEVAGVNRSTTVEFTNGGQAMTIRTNTRGSPTVETYVRE